MKKTIYLLISLILLLVSAGPIRAEKKATADTMMRPYIKADMEHVVIRKAPKGRYAMYCGVTKLPDGEIFCVFKVGSRDPKTGSPWTVRDETMVWTKSKDGGRT